jgi:hypothetical protein
MGSFKTTIGVINMYKKTALFLAMSSLIATPTFASNFFQKFTSKHHTKKTSSSVIASKAKTGSSTFTDFSGTWIGNCAGYTEADTLTITNTDNFFVINGMEFLMNSLQTFSDSYSDSTYFTHMLLQWNEDHSTVMLDGSFAAYSGNALQAEFGYMKGSISLKNDQLIMEFSDHTTSGYDDQTVCTYSKQ